MKNKAKFALHVVAVFFLMNVAVTQLSATTAYFFTGTCSNCTGVSSGLLTLSSYLQGQAVNSSNFVEFDYSSNLTSFSITPLTLDSIGGTIPASLPSAASITIFGTNSVFIAQLNGQWCVSNVSNTCSFSGAPSDFGFSGTFEPTPEPGTLGLALAGLAALGWSQRRKLLRPIPIQI